MERANEHQDGPTTPPVDADEERQRLIDDATAAGVEPQEALEVAERVARGTPEADALRAVDRRVATGYSPDEAEEVLQGQQPRGAEAESEEE